MSASDAFPVAFPGFLGWLAVRLERGFVRHDARSEANVRSSRVALSPLVASRGRTERSTTTQHEVGSLVPVAHRGPGALR